MPSARRPHRPPTPTVAEPIRPLAHDWVARSVAVSPGRARDLAWPVGPRLAMFGDLLVAAGRTGWRRWRRGPLRPSWSWLFETVVAAMRAGTARMHHLPWPERRAALERLVLPSSGLRGVERTPLSAAGVPCEWFTPRGAPDDGPCLLYLHGGSYVFGSVNTRAGLIARLALAARARVLAADYRLAPEHPFPAAVRDAVALCRFLRQTGVDPRRIVLAGDSAGGGLCLAALLCLREAGEPLPAASVLICPWVDLAAEGGSLAANEVYDWGRTGMFRMWADTYLAGGELRDPLASPLHARLEGLPPLLVQVGDAEMLLDQATELARRARAAGVAVELDVVPDMIHNWHLLAAFHPAGRAAVARIGEFVARHATMRVAVAPGRP